ncbi:LysM peptidoglycan-binding domain-containing protein [Arundinibacter roseus]|uniref:LysM domain-containing protein n=1 Tax=Arundinibacter roseus TaxID=2070510 RepID=A0A4R4K505_9BACT|nr:LysM peptidoglycan-binding domain-containing protein [Arundinibacter roseus]TDB62383.1 LysM domain-containing protein [Arundinibacter roseus]
MEEENPKPKNIRPDETSKLPLITLLTLVGIIIALFLIGYEYITDDTTGSEEVTNISPDTTTKVLPIEVEPEPIIEEEAPAEIVDKPVATETPTPEPAKPEPKAEPKPVAVDPGGTEIKHTVRPGETFFGIANRYNLTAETLKSLNPSIKDVTKDLKADVTKLNVRVQAVHTVGPGDVLRVVAGKYGISKQLLMEANGKTRDISNRGEKLIIPFKSKK